MRQIVVVWKQMQWEGVSIQQPFNWSAFYFKPGYAERSLKVQQVLRETQTHDIQHTHRRYLVSIHPAEPKPPFSFFLPYAQVNGRLLCGREDLRQHLKQHTQTQTQIHNSKLYYHLPVQPFSFKWNHKIHQPISYQEDKADFLLFECLSIYCWCSATVNSWLYY